MNDLKRIFVAEIAILLLAGTVFLMSTIWLHLRVAPHLASVS